MAKLNTKEKVARAPVLTAQGAPADRVSSEASLRRAVMSCLLWEDAFYEDGVEISERIKSLVPKVAPEAVAAIAVEARTDMNLRHVPLLLVREMARHESHRALVADTLEKVIQRPDELTEFLAIYWAKGREKLAAQVKKGLAKAFPKFNEYSLAKYNPKDAKIRLRDVLFLAYPKPTDKAQEKVWKRLAEDKLETPDTWEVQLSAGKDKKETFTRLIKEGKLGALAFIRNLRNMEAAGVPEKVIKAGFEDLDVSRVLPFRFLVAARHAPKFESQIESLLFKATEDRPKLKGKTIFVVDLSGSMGGSILSGRSELNRIDVACSLATLARESCEEVAVYGTAGNDGLVKHATAKVPSRRGFALADALRELTRTLGGGGIFLTQVTEFLREKEKEAARIIVITDEQDCDHDPARAASNAKPFGKFNYIINVGTSRNGIGYKKWTHIDGWSEAVLNYILVNEQGAKQAVKKSRRSQN